MTQATITPKYVDAPKAGKKLGSIKDQHNEYWSVDPGLLGSFRAGAAISVEWEMMKFHDGTERKKITGIVHGTAPHGNGARQSEPAPDKDRLIWLTGIVGRAMGSGKFEANEITALTAAALSAWEIVQSGGRHLKVDSPDVLKDSVPF